MVYAGIDVHRKRSQVSLIDVDGRELLNRNVDNGSEAMLDILEDLEPGTPVAFEAAYGWGWLADLLEERELEAHLVHPSACKAIASARLKNDKVDARMLAHLLRTELLPEAWIAPKEVQIGTVGGLPVILGPALPYEVGRHVEKDGGLSLPGVHVVMGAGDTPGDRSGGLPIG